MKSVFKGILAVVLAFIGWVLRKAQDDREARDAAEFQAKSANEYTEKLMRIEVDHEKRVEEINDGGLSDDCASELLSSDLGEDAAAAIPKNGKS